MHNCISCTVEMSEEEEDRRIVSDRIHSRHTHVLLHLHNSVYNYMHVHVYTCWPILTAQFHKIIGRSVWDVYTCMYSMRQKKTFHSCAVFIPL